MKQQNKYYVPVAVVEEWYHHIGHDDREPIRDSLYEDGVSLLKQYRHFVLGHFIKGFSDPVMKKWVFFPSEGRYLPERLAPF